MLSTLFHIPARITLGGASLPVFGWGLLLVVWAVAGVAVLARTARDHGWRNSLETLGVPLAIAAATILWLLPALDDGQGVPVRGYGAMLLVAAMAATWLAIARGRAMGFDADTILALGVEVFLWGIVGARLFFVIEYHDQFFNAGRSWLESLTAVLNVAAGGLVVFGALPTAALAVWRFASRRGLSLSRLADCVAPSLLVGLSIGRIGCFLNGCCYGGPCDLPWAVQFPPESPPWLDQAARGLLPHAAPGGGPPWSLPVHPAQLYASIDAAILAVLALCYTPLARRDGQVFALVLTLHPISRLLLEAIRVDEPPALGTPLSISQLVSLVLLALAATVWWWTARQPPRPLDGLPPAAGGSSGGGGRPGGAVHPESLTIRCREHGPLVVEMPTAAGFQGLKLRVTDHLGREFPLPAGKRAVALCRCGQTQSKPFCDGSHKLSGFDAAGTAAD
ncbi:MAG: prolipoprotein diacylglyceryl transferase [Planctomycetes bacterium]|nr:prolipoprotein diacylglyceryl transferase [Planctomycetota bacterium]